jgi:hypothetical protein
METLMIGRCTCGAIRFRLTSAPMFIHACHCTWCQRETGGPHAVNAMIEGDRVKVLTGVPVEVVTPSASGKGQVIVRCGACHTALWSHYAGMGRKTAFVRVGTLDEPGVFPPDIHIFAGTMQAWYRVAEGVPVVAEYYDRKAHWPDDALARFEVLKRG